MRSNRQLPDTLLDFLRKQDPPLRTLSSQLKAHLRRELFHAIWRLLLDDDLVRAYVHGIPMICGDGVERRMYIRLFSYSADYPEKCVHFFLHLALVLKYLHRALITLIRDNGVCPCPLCKLHKADIDKLGTVAQTKQLAGLKRTDDEHRRALVNKARALIYSKNGVSLSNTNVEGLLKRTSLVPTIVRIVPLTLLVLVLIIEPRLSERVQRPPRPLRFRFSRHDSS